VQWSVSGLGGDYRRRGRLPPRLPVWGAGCEELGCEELGCEELGCEELRVIVAGL
jgi:hypothetical protein